jgi:peptide/nickel transport system ATP-binding protein
VTETSGTGDALLEVRDVSRRFVKKLDLAARIARRLGADVSEEVVHAVDGVSLTVDKGEVVGLVGESGCGKSTLGRMVSGILEPSEGEVRFHGASILDRGSRAARQAALGIQMIFQDPFASLNPRMRVADIVGEAPLSHGIVDRAGFDDYLDDVLQRCGLDPNFKRRYPHQFSGGQRQRIGIARALAVRPEFLVCDESVAALDVSIQAQVLNLFMELRETLDLTYLFISHDLGVVATEALFEAPSHPYTRALLEEVPRLETRRSTYEPIKGEIPSPLEPPSGCHFHPRCPHATARCREEVPQLREVAPGWHSACHLNDDA